MKDHLLPDPLLSAHSSPPPTHHLAPPYPLTHDPRTTMARKYLIGGNWKCNGTKENVAALVSGDLVHASQDFKDCCSRSIC